MEQRVFLAKIDVTQVAVVFGTLVALTSILRPWRAQRASYQDDHGLPWFTLSCCPIYLPRRLLDWWKACGVYARRLVLLGVENVRDHSKKPRVDNLLSVF